MLNETLADDVDEYLFEVKSDGSSVWRTVAASVGHPDAGPLVYSYHMIGDDWSVIIETDGGDYVAFCAPWNALQRRK